MLGKLPEGSGCVITAKFVSLNGTGTAPTDMFYRIDCETTNTALLGWTSIVPAVSVDIAVDASINIMQRRNNDLERKVMTVMANSGGTPDNPIGNTKTQIIEWDLIRLEAFD